MEENEQIPHEFASAKYMNVETYRRSGDSIRTPVWFVQSGELLFFLTRADSGKVKRLRHNPEIKVATCKMNGEVTGSWHPAQAIPLETNESIEAVKTLFDQKYGAAIKLSLAFSRLKKTRHVFYKIMLQTK
jgi:PPOX class probable F420-dependent enzyme